MIHYQKTLCGYFRYCTVYQFLHCWPPVILCASSLGRHSGKITISTLSLLKKYFFTPARVLTKYWLQFILCFWETDHHTGFGNIFTSFYSVAITVLSCTTVPSNYYSDPSHCSCHSHCTHHSHHGNVSSWMWNSAKIRYPNHFLCSIVIQSLYSHIILNWFAIYPKPCSWTHK